MPKVSGFRDFSNGANKGRPKKLVSKMAIGKPVSNIFTFPLITPRGYQIPVWKAYNNGAKNIVLSMPRRHGKDLTSTSIAIDYALRNPHSSVVLLAPTKAWGRRIWWDKGQSFEVTDPVTGFVRKLGGSLLDVCIPDKCRQSTNNTDARITLYNGSTIQIYGSDEAAFIGMKINFVVVSEMARHKKDIFPLLSPILEEAGGVSIFNGTVTDENNHFWNMIQNVKQLAKDDHEFFCQYLTIEDTKTSYWISDIDPVTNQREFNINPELANKINPKTGAKFSNLHKKVLMGESKSFVVREYVNIPTFTEEGSYYDECIKHGIEEGRISDIVSWDPKFPVCTAWDIGHSDKTCITFFQVLDNGNHIKIIDYFEYSKKGPDYYIDIVRSKPYRYKAHFAPHDISQRKWGMKQSALDLCRDEYKFDFLRIPQSNSTVDDINVCRSYIQKCHIAKTPCKDLIASLLNYHENPNTQKPQHDEHSHGADSFRYCILAIHKGLIPAHDLMGNNADTKQRFNRQPLVGNVNDITTKRQFIDGFPTNVDVMEEFFPNEATWLGYDLDG